MIMHHVITSLTVTQKSFVVSPILEFGICWKDFFLISHFSAADAGQLEGPDGARAEQSEHTGVVLAGPLAFVLEEIGINSLKQ